MFKIISFDYFVCVIFIVYYQVLKYLKRSLVSHVTCILCPIRILYHLIHHRMKLSDYMMEAKLICATATISRLPIITTISQLCMPVK